MRRIEGICVNEGVSSCMLNLGTGWEEWSASNSGCFTPRKKVLFSHWIGGCMDPDRGLDALQRKVSCLCWELKFNSFFVHYVSLIFHNATVPSGPAPLLYQGFTTTLDRALIRTPLDERSARCRENYLTTYNTEKRKSSTHRLDSKPQSQEASGRRTKQ